MSTYRAVIQQDGESWIGWIEEILKPDRRFEFWDSDETFYKVAAKTPRSSRSTCASGPISR